MSTRRPPSADGLAKLLAAAAFLAVGAAFGAPGRSAPEAALEAEFRATYPMTAPAPASLYAGVEIDKLAIPGLRVTARDVRTAEEGGLGLSFADGAGAVRVLVQVAVARDVASARRVVDARLHGVATILVPTVDATLGDVAYADDAGNGATLVVASAANVAYSVHVVRADTATPTAATIARQLRAHSVPGTPSYPTTTLSLASTIDATSGDDLHVVPSVGATVSVRAVGAYLSRRGSAWVLHPYQPGRIEVEATAVDGLGRVGTTSATTVAK